MADTGGATFPDTIFIVFHLLLSHLFVSATLAGSPFDFNGFRGSTRNTAGFQEQFTYFVRYSGCTIKCGAHSEDNTEDPLPCPPDTATDLSAPESKPEALEADCRDAPTGTPSSQDEEDLELGEGENRRGHVASTLAARPDEVSEEERAKKNLLLGVSLLFVDSHTSLFKPDSPSRRCYVALTSLCIAFSFIVWHAGRVMPKKAEQVFLWVSTIALYGALMILLAVSLHGVF